MPNGKNEKAPEVDGIPKSPKVGEKFRIKRREAETGEEVLYLSEVMDVKENETTDGTPGAQIIVCMESRQ